MTSQWRFWCPAALLLAGAALAQPGDKPVTRVAEPMRASGDGRTVQVVEIEYSLASRNNDRFPEALSNLFAYLRSVPDLGLQGKSEAMRLDDLPAAGRGPILLYMTSNSATLQLSDAEKTNLGKLLKQGVLLFAEEIRQSDATTGLIERGAGMADTFFDRQFKELVRDRLVLGVRGQVWEKVPRSHPLYSCYYELSDGPPRGGAPGGNVTDLEMLQFRGRPAVIFSDLNISWYWGDPLCRNRERGLQFGVNLLVFALTQGLAP